MKTVNFDQFYAMEDGYKFIVAEIYWITLAGTEYCFTSGESDLLLRVGEGPLTAIALPIEREDITVSMGLSVDECKVSIYCDGKYLFNNLSIPNFALIGGFDNAYIKIELNVILGNEITGFEQIIHLFEGAVTDVRADLSRVELTVSSQLVLLDAQVPRAIYQSTCLHTLFDTACGLSKAGFTESQSVANSFPSGEIFFTDSNASGFYELGRITFTSGANMGLSRTVRVHTMSIGVSEILPSYPFPFIAAIGDTFTISPGCNKSRAMCTAKFSNATQFLGFEYIPVPEASS